MVKLCRVIQFVIPGSNLSVLPALQTINVVSARPIAVLIKANRSSNSSECYVEKKISKKFALKFCLHFWTQASLCRTETLAGLCVSYV